MATSDTSSDLDTLFQLPAEQRYEQFVQRVAQTKQVWGLVSERGWSLAAEEENTCLALWADAEHARACALEAWADAEPQPLSLDEFRELLTQLELDRIMVAAVMTPQGRGLVVNAGELLVRLQAELDIQ